MVLLEKDNGLSWYFNRIHRNLCDGFYWASIVFLAKRDKGMNEICQHLLTPMLYFSKPAVLGRLLGKEM